MVEPMRVAAAALSAKGSTKEDASTLGFVTVLVAEAAIVKVPALACPTKAALRDWVSAAMFVVIAWEAWRIAWSDIM